MASIIVADDDELARSAIGAMLKEFSHDVRYGADGAELLKEIDAQPPDAVIVDLIMPVNEGIETILSIRRDRPALPVVAITAGGSRSNYKLLDIARLAGANAGLRKPFTSSQLRDSLDQAMRVEEARKASNGS